MPLPTSRDLTINPTDPIPSSLLNKLQDCTVGMKFPLHDRPIGPASWQVKAGGNASLGDGQWTFGALSQLVAPLELPYGTTIATVLFAYNRGGAGNITLKLRKRNIATGAAAADIASVVINAGTGWTTSGLSPSYATETNFAVWLEAQFDNAAHIFGGAIAVLSRL